MLTIPIMMINTFNHFLRENPLFVLYIASLVVDIITGNIAAWLDGDIDSTVGLKGTIKHLGVLSFIIILLPAIEYYMQEPIVSLAILSYITYQYLISVVENIGKLGYDLPQPVKDKFRRLKDDGDRIDISQATKIEIDTEELKRITKKDDIYK